MWRVGVDSGGTFTDVCLVDDATGAIRVWKVPSTPDDPSRAIAGGTLEGLRERAHASAAGAAHDARLSRSPRDRPPAAAAPLRSAGGQASRPRAAPPARGDRRAAAPRRARGDAARRGAGARGRP